MKNENKKKLAEEWIKRAESDLKYARAGDRETAEHHITCYLCHQSVEKALKGLLVLADTVPQKTHNLGLLMSGVILHYPALSAHQKGVRKLDKFYIPARYPNGIEMEFREEDAKNALDMAETILSLANDILYKETN